MHPNLHLIALCIALLMTFTTPVLASTLEEMVRMADQLDQLDKADFDTLVSKASGCTQRRDFRCAETGLAQAAKLARDNRDRTSLAQAHASIAKERALMQKEIEEERLAEQRLQKEKEELVAQAEREEKCEKFCETQVGLSACYRGQIDPWQCSDYETRRRGGTNYGAAIVQGINQTLQGHAQITSIHNQAMANLQAAQEERARQRQFQQENQRAQLAQASQERRAAQQATRESERQTQRAGGSSSAGSGGGSVAVERSGTTQRDQAAEQRRKDEQDARERRVREQQEQEERKQRQLAERQAQRNAEAAKQAQAKAGYLGQMQSGIRLVARQCYGKQYVVGTRPRIKPEVVSCVDVHYRAQCTTADNSQFIDGVGKTFVGMGTDCFSGDNYAIEPKLSCDVKEIQVTLKEVRACNE